MTNKIEITAYWIIGLLSLFSLPAGAQVLPTSAFFDRAGLDEVKISPDGEHLAITLSSEEESQLIILQLPDRQAIASFNTRKNQKVGEFHWVNNERIIFTTLVFAGGFDAPFQTGEVFALNIDNSRKFQLLGSGVGDYAAYSLVHMLPNDENHVRVVRQEIRRRSVARSRPESFLLDVYSPPRRSLTRTQSNLRGRVTGPLPWGELYSDNAGEIRIAAATNENSQVDVFYRHEGEWVDISSRLLLTESDFNGIQFAGFDTSTDSLFYVAEGEHGTDSLHRYTHNSGEVDVVFQHPNFDIQSSDLIYASDQSTILGVNLIGDVFEQYYFSEHPEAKIYQSLDATFPGEMARVTSATLDGSVAIVSVAGPRRIGDFYLLDTATMNLEPLLSRSGSLLPKQMAEVTPFAIKTADDFILHGYVTQPIGSDGPLPTIVIPHGGPIGVRDRPFFNREAQFFAHNGFAVLQVNFRGSGGYGSAFEEAGYRQWGLGMVDDITLATHWAIQKGIAAENKICIYGASYGAYAALTSVVRERDQYQCAIGYAGIYDLTKLDRSDIPWQPGGDTYLDIAVGVDENSLRSQSPINSVDEIDVPIFIVHGGQDKRAPPFQARDLRDALEDAEVEFEWLFERRESHGFYSTENNIKLYDQLLRFLKKHTE